MRDCKSAQVTIQTLGSRPGIGEVVDDDVQAGTGQQEKTFAQVLKEASFTALLQTQQKQQKLEQAAAQLKKEENAARVKAIQDKRVKEKRDREEEGRKKMEEKERNIAHMQDLNKQIEVEQAKLANHQSLDLSIGMSNWAEDHPDDAMWKTPLVAREMEQSNLAVQPVTKQPDERLAAKENISTGQSSLAVHSSPDQSDGEEEGDMNGDACGRGFAIKSVPHLVNILTVNTLNLPAVML